MPTLTALENITLPLDIARRHVDRAHLDLVVETLGLTDRLGHKPSELSGGQQQRVACARALVARPAVVFADEPTGNLDSTSAAEVLGFLRSSVDELGQSVVMVTHDPTSAGYAHRVLFLADGRLVGELRDPTAETVLAALTAHPRRRALMVRVALRGVRAHLVRFCLSVLAVALGVAFVAGTFALRTMLSSTFTDIVATTTLGDAYVRGSEPAGGTGGPDRISPEVRNPVPLTLVDELEAVDGVAAVLPDVQGPLVLVGADGTAVQSTQAPSFAFSYDPRDPAVDVVAGRAPAGADEIAVESASLAASGLAIGDATSVVVGGEVRPVTVVGEMGLGAALAGATVVFLDPATAEAAFAPDGTVATISVLADDGLTEQQLVDRLAPVLADVGRPGGGGHRGRGARAVDREHPHGPRVHHDVPAGLRGDLAVRRRLHHRQHVLHVGPAADARARPAAGGRARRRCRCSPRSCCRPRSSGWSARSSAWPAGSGSSSCSAGCSARFGMELTGRVPLDGFTLVVSVLVGTLVSVLAAALPARRAALVPPVEALRDEVTPAGALADAGGPSWGSRWWCWASPRSSSRCSTRPRTTPERCSGSVRARWSSGCSPRRRCWRAGSCGWPPCPFAAWRPVGPLARGNVTRNPRRTANTAGALMIGMALVGAAAVIAATTQASTSAIVTQEATTDYILRGAAQGTVPEQAVVDVRALPDVRAADTFATASVLVGDSAFAVTGIDPDGRRPQHPDRGGRGRLPRRARGRRGRRAADHDGRRGLVARAGARRSSARRARRRSRSAPSSTRPRSACRSSCRRTCSTRSSRPTSSA